MFPRNRLRLFELYVYSCICGIFSYNYITSTSGGLSDINSKYSPPDGKS